MRDYGTCCAASLVSVPATPVGRQTDVKKLPVGHGSKPVRRHSALEREVDSAPCCALQVGSWRTEPSEDAERHANPEQKFKRSAIAVARKNRRTDEPVLLLLFRSSVRPSQPVHA